MGQLATNDQILPNEIIAHLYSENYRFKIIEAGRMKANRTKPASQIFSQDQENNMVNDLKSRILKKLKSQI